VVIGIISDAMLSKTAPADADTVKVAFECMQMVVADFLPTVPSRCYLFLLNTLGSFGRQQADVNVALTAVGLLWQVSDYLSQNRISMEESLREQVSGNPGRPRGSSNTDSADTQGGDTSEAEVDLDGLPTRLSLDDIWMCLYREVAALCVDARADVRRSACQTLYSTLETHAPLLDTTAFLQAMEQVVLPTVAKVHELSAVAVVEEATDPAGGDDGGLRLHHSMDSAAKRWAETKRLTVSGLVKVIITSFDRLAAQQDAFLRTWEVVLRLCADWARDPSNEVASSATQALATLCRLPPASGHGAGPAVATAWDSAFETWRAMCSGVGAREPPHRGAVLATLAQTLPPLYAHVHTHFSAQQASVVAAALRALLATEGSDAMVLSRMSDEQSAVLEALQVLAPSQEYPHTDFEALIVVLRELLRYADYGLSPPWRLRGRNTFSWLGSAALTAFVMHFGRYAEEHRLVCSGVAAEALRSLVPLLQQRYGLENRQLWREAMRTLVAIGDLGMRGLAAIGKEVDAAIVGGLITFKSFFC
jgi:hypothetical protein